MKTKGDDDNRPQRLREVASFLGTRKNAARICDISLRQFQNYLNGTHDPSPDVVARLAVASGFGFDWIAFGTGPKKVGEPLPPGAIPSRAQVGDVLDRVIDPSDVKPLAELILGAHAQFQSIGIEISEPRAAQLQAAFRIMYPQLVARDLGLSKETAHRLLDYVIGVSIREWSQLDAELWDWLFSGAFSDISQGVAHAQDIGDAVGPSGTVDTTNVLRQLALVSRHLARAAKDRPELVADTLARLQLLRRGRGFLDALELISFLFGWNKTSATDLGKVVAVATELLESIADDTQPVRAGYLSLGIRAAVLEFFATEFATSAGQSGGG